MMGTVVMTEVLTGMRKHLKHQNSPGKWKGLCRNSGSRSAGNRVRKWKRSDISRRRIFYIPCRHYRCVSRKGDNLLVIACSNEMKDSVYPQSADFTFYGGALQRVNLISVPDVHFDLEYYGGPGIQVTPRPCECGGAEFEIVSYVKRQMKTLLFCILFAMQREMKWQVPAVRQMKLQ